MPSVALRGGRVSALAHRFSFLAKNAKEGIRAVNMSRFLKVFSAVSIFLTAVSAQTGTLKVYLSPPAAQSSTVAGVTTETFDSLNTVIQSAYTSPGIGTYAGPFGIMAPDQYGGATDATHTSSTNYLGVGKDSNSTAPVVLTLNNPASYFGFWWSAGDQYNRVDLYSGSTLYATFSTQDILTFLNNGNGNITALNGTTYPTKSYFGNPNRASGSNDSTEPFVYVSFVITGVSINKLAFYNLSTASAFESDNHSVIFSGSTPTIPTTFVSEETLTLQQTVVAPTFSPMPGIYTSAQNVTITSATSGATIRYTTNGTTMPSETVGTVYTSGTPVAVTATETINAIAYKSGLRDSAVVPAAYTISPPAVSVISPTSGKQGQVLTGVQITGQFTHFVAGTSTVSFSNTGVTASAVTVTSATQLTATLTINTTAATGTSNVTVTTGSEVATGSSLFTVTAGTPVVLSLNPASGAQGTAPTGVVITGRFTHFTSGTPAVTFSNPGVTASAIVVTDATHLTATLTITPTAALGASNVTVTTGSEVATGSSLFTVTAGTPVVSTISTTSGKQGQTITNVQITGQFTHFTSGTPAVSFSNTGVSAVVTTVTDATHLTATLTILGSASTGPSSVTVTTGTETAPGGNLFTVTAGTPVAPPTFSPPGGNYTSAQSVTIRTTTSIATIHYTTDGSIPSETAGTKYTAPIPVSVTTTIKAMAFKSGMADSTVVPATYTISLPVAAPTFNPPAGTYPLPQMVTLSSTTPGAFIRYVACVSYTCSSISPPSETNGTSFTWPVTVVGATTIEAIAYNGTSPDSTISSATYLIGSANPLWGQPESAVMLLPSETFNSWGVAEAPAGMSPTDIVTWLASPGNLGTLSSANGSFTYAAPASFPSGQIDQLVGTDQTTNKTTTLLVYLTNHLRINSGGDWYTDPSGNIWSGDPMDYTGMNWPEQYSRPSGISTGVTPGANAPTYLLREEVYGWPGPGTDFSYGFNLPPGSYDVTLHFAADPSWPGAASVYYYDNNSQQTAVSIADAVTEAGGPWLPLDKQFIATLSPSGPPASTYPLAIWFHNLPVSGIEIMPTGLLEVAPARTALAASQTQQFDTGGIPVTYAPPSAGTITSSGLYTAPASITAPQVVAITATSVANPAQSSTAYVYLEPPTPQPLALSGVSPATVNLTPSQSQLFLPVGNPAVTWSSSSPSIGYLTQEGYYTAPASISSQQTLTITATSVPYPSQVFTAQINLFPPVVISPCAVTLFPGQTQQFTSTVPVTWSIPPTAPGHIDKATGLYTAPTTPTGQQVIVTATSTADPGATSTSTITLIVPGSSYSHHRPITIDHTKVPNTDQTNFPVLISGIYPFLAASNSGGQVQNANGYDIIFTSDYAGTTKLDHEIESYDPGTGTINMWVRVPVLSHSCDTIIYLAYGSANVFVSQENTTGVWDSNYKAVWHLKNGVNLSAADSTSNGANGTVYGPTAISGQVDGAAGFNGGQYLDMGNLGARPVQGAISMWVNAPALTNYPNAFTTGPLSIACGNAAIRFELHDDGYFGASTGADSADCGSGYIGPSFTTSFVPGVWHHAAVTWDSAASVENIYYDGQLAQTVPNSNWPTNFGAVKIGIGWDTTRGWVGGVDEVRMSSTLRSADWVATEFANQSSPSAFASIGPENTIGVNVCPSSVIFQSGGLTQQFTAIVTNTSNQTVTWNAPPAGAGTFNPASGLYTAPNPITATQNIALIATSQADPTKSGLANIALYAAGSSILSPSSVSLSGGQTQQFTATLANGGSATATWLLSPTVGSISATGLYTAPSSVYTPQTITLTGTVAGGITGTATITLVPNVTVSISPATSNLGPLQTQQFTANVAGTWTTGVTWSVPSGVGWISPTGLYTAPASIPSPTTATVIATSAANPNATATATINLSPQPLVTVTPGSVTLTSYQTQQFSASISGGAAVNWSINPNLGNIASTGLYTAPAVATAQAVTITAANASNPAQSGVASITLIPAATNAYSYRRAIVIDHTKVPNTDQVNFPVLITGTYGYLATVANSGGHVQSASGYDIIFSSDCAGLQQLDHEIGSYNATNGAVSMWVLIPNVSYTEDTVFYMSYGNSAITTSQENRPPVDAARNPNTPHSADWIATAANNQNSPATFYTIYPENTNSVDPPTATVSAGQTQQFLPLFTVSAATSIPNPLVLLGTSMTPSPAESVAVNGNYAYVCDDNEVSVFDATNPANPLFLRPALANDLSSDGIAWCTVQNRPSGAALLAFVSQSTSSYFDSDNPVFLAFSLQDPAAPQLVADAGIHRNFFRQPVYSSDGNTAFVPTYAVQGGWTQFGDVLAVDVTNLSSATLLDSMEPSAGSLDGYGGANVMFGAGLANPTTLLVGGSTSTGGANNGVGELVVLDVTNPAAMSIVTSLSVPNTVQIYTPVLLGNFAVALGDTGGWKPGTINSRGSLVLTTFDITNPRSPAVLSSIVLLPYTNFREGPAVQIGPNQSLFAGVSDSSGNPLLLLVDTTNPLNPTVTPYSVPSFVTEMTVSGNLLHVTAGPAGYAIYQIPGVTASQYHLTGSCGGPFNWTLSTQTPGASISASGLYTAPASVTPGQTVAVTATAQNDYTQTATAAVNLSGPLTLSLNPTTPGPYVVGGSAKFTATVTSGGAPAPDHTVTLAVSGANSTSAFGLTGLDGTVTLTYTGTARGLDSIKASANGFTSNTLSELWVSPAAAFTTTPVLAEFFKTTSCASGCEAFTTASGTVPTFEQNFPDLMFNATNSSPSPRSFADIILGPSGAPTGSILAQGRDQTGNGYTAGAPDKTGTPDNPGAHDMTGFSAVFTGNFVVAQPGNYTINVFSQDGFIFGVGNGAQGVSGIVNPPGTVLTVFWSYPVMGAYNRASSNASTPIVVSFPTAGSYPYEFDYKSGTGGPLAFTVTVGQGAAATGVGSLESLVLTSNTSSPVAGQQASFTVKATDETGAPIASLPVTVNVVGGAPQTLHGTTNSTGLATVSYTESAAMTDLLQASALVNSLQLVSAQTTVAWAAAKPPSQAPLISINGDQVVYLPNLGSYTAAVTDPAAGAGGAITVTWSQTGGPGAVTFSAAQQLATTVNFPAIGTYMLQITASDTLGSRTIPVGPITVNVPAPITVPSGWIGSPADHSQVTGVVPISVVSGESLASCTLSYSPTANPSAGVPLDTTASACGTKALGTLPLGTLATLDTTLLANGSYYIYLQAIDSNGKSMASGVDILVGGDYKPGRVTTTVTDLVVPAPGLPIQISRTYDSLVRNTSSDFGYGWTLGVNVQLDVSADYDVTLTINGQRRTFYFAPYVPGFQLDGSNFPNLLGAYFPAYSPEPGLHGTLNVWSGGSSLIGSNTGCTLDMLQPWGNSYFCYDNAGTYSPGGYVYTDPYGRVYTISSTGGLQSVQDVAGNAINITPGGITSTNGLNVPFVRDSQGRITQITDPLNQVYTYAYDSNGNLASVAYPVSPAHPSDPKPMAQYTYNATDTHLYAGGTDPQGNQLPTTTYDSNGRLQTVTLHPYSDPSGSDPTKSYKTSYNYATTPVTVNYPDGTTASGLTTTVTNPDNTAVTQVYDSYGMLLSSTDPLSNTTLNEYDAYHNLISVTDPLGHTNSYTYDSNGNKLSSTYPQPTPNNPVNTTSYTTYNAYSEPSGTTDELGNPRNFTYDSNFWPQLASDSIGPVVSFTFNANGTMASKAVGYDLTQTSDAATKYTYDQYGNLQTQTDPLGNATTYSYDNLGRKISMTLPARVNPSAPGASTNYTYDALGNLLSVTVTDPTTNQSRVTQYTYDMNGNKTSETDPDGAGHTTNYAYDGLNRLITVTYPATPATSLTPAAPSTFTTYTYDFRNNVIDTTTGSTSQQTGHTTHNDYYQNGWLKDVITTSDVPADARTTSYTYYNDGRKASETDPRGNVTQYTYDPAGRLITVTAGYGTPQATTTTYAYDDAGNQTSVTTAYGTPMAATTSSGFDARRRLAKTTYADNTNTQYTYDGPGNLIQVIDQANNKVQYTYDLNNQLKTVVQVNAPDSSHNTTTYGYDTNGNLISLEDANTHTTQNAFDGFNQLQQETMPANQSQTRTYDGAGNLQTLLDYNGKTTTYTYDSMNRLLSRQPDPSLTTDVPESFTYTPTGKRATMTDASGITTYIYDDHDRLSQKQTPQGTLTYTYDAAGNVASMRSSNTNGIYVEYTYDSLNRLQTVVDHGLVGQQTTTYSYDPASNLATVEYPNGLQSTFSYDTLNRITRLSNAAANYTYTLDGTVGNRTGVTEKLATLPGARMVGWSYDGIYRLTNENISADPNSKTGEVTYGLDPVGNRLSLGLSQGSNLPGISAILPGSVSYDQDDRLSTEDYDPNGNTLKSGGKTFTYDFANRLKSMAAGSVSVTIQHDADGNRVAKTVNGVTTRYLVDDLNPTGYAQVVEEVTGTTASRTYTYGIQRISQNQQVSNAWTPSFYGYDGGGTVRLLTDSTGTVTDTYDYDAWGNEVNTTGSTPNVYLYRGEQYDTDLGLYYLRARHYNPLTGRFLTKDPAGVATTDPSVLHQYLYATANPTNRIDPTGWADSGDSAKQGNGAGLLIFDIRSGGYVAFSPSRLATLMLQAMHVDFCSWFPGRDPSKGSGDGPVFPPIGGPIGGPIVIGTVYRGQNGTWVNCDAAERDACAAMCGPRGVKSCKKFVTLKIKRIKDPGFTLWKRTGPPSCECNDPKDCKNPPEDPYCAPGEPAGTGDCIPFRWPLRFGGLGPIPINPGEPVLGGGPAPEPVGGPIFGQPPIWAY